MKEPAPVASQMAYPRSNHACFSAIALIVAALVGCGESIRFAPVRGQVLVKGVPAKDVRLEFHPDAAGGTRGPSSSGETDAEGRFELAYATQSKHGAGAAIGTHKVVLRDMALAASETGIGVPVRFGPEYANLSTTPLSATITAGGEDLVIEVPSNSVRNP